MDLSDCFRISFADITEEEGPVRKSFVITLFM